MTNPSFQQHELELLLKTAVQLRSLLFNCTSIKIDPKSLANKNHHSEWQGKRGEFPSLPDIEKCLALLRLHINSDEAIQLYEAMGFYDNESNFFIK